MAENALASDAGPAGWSPRGVRAALRRQAAAPAGTLDACEGGASLPRREVLVETRDVGIETGRERHGALRQPERDAPGRGGANSPSDSPRSPPSIRLTSETTCCGSNGFTSTASA